MLMRTAAAFALLVLVSACQAPPPEMTDSQRAEIENAVSDAATAQQNDWIAQEDMDTYISHHSAWGLGVWPGVNSLDDLRTQQTTNWERWDYEQTGPLVEWEAQVLAPTVAAVRSSFQLTRTDTTPDAVDPVRVFDVDQAQVWVLEGAGWKLLVAKEKWTRANQ